MLQHLLLLKVLQQLLFSALNGFSGNNLRNSCGELLVWKIASQSVAQQPPALPQPYVCFSHLHAQYDLKDQANVHRYTFLDAGLCAFPRHGFQALS